jgi:polyisoprenoid-binding protein YceI
MKRIAACVFACGMALWTGGSAQAAGVSMDPAAAPGGTYQLETAHSQLLFAIEHFGLTEYYGRFDRLSGTLNYNAAKPEASSVSVSVETGSVDTPSDRLNAELSGPNVFDAAKFPDATFKSTSVTRTGPGTGTITGDLTLHGVTKPVTLDATFTGTAEMPMGGSNALGFSANATIKRSDFGLTGMTWNAFVGDNVKLIVVAMFQRGSR